MDFHEYVASRRQPLLRLAYLLTGDTHLAEDVVQTALLQAFRQWRRVSRADQPDAYVRRMVVNAFIDRKRRHSSSEAPTAPADLPATPQRDHTDDHAERSVMWRSLAGLPRVQRAVLVLRFYEDLDDARIAELLGTSPSTVRSNASRALATLRKEWTRV
ncbi:RNA polymerase sigma-70 factor (sigma-E family) [Jiangella mangrovi]|uniref:RNA polymerase sigma-70 factor (Sigma-E family) n=1 Tax=Jiangella mangrovi TaxID=1524084 RepID=A0A7W9GMU6_9ACTN|nr:RNA polymerase sigma-70 factor (sigma-E family) [Jiangella mangrovi]